MSIVENAIRGYWLAFQETRSVPMRSHPHARECSAEAITYPLSNLAFFLNVLRYILIENAWLGKKI